MIIAIIAGVLMAGAFYLFMQREMLRVILGFVLLGHAANLIIMAAGGTNRRGQPFGTPDDLTAVADPLPQAFVLTAIVISFAITVFMLVLAVTGKGTDDTTDGATDDLAAEPAAVRLDGSSEEFGAVTSGLTADDDGPADDAADTDDAADAATDSTEPEVRA